MLETYGVKAFAPIADGVNMYVRILNNINLLQLQHTIDALLRWAEEWQLTVSVAKCCVLHIGQLVLLPKLTMQNVFLPNVNGVRDHGINVTNCLSPADHVCEITAKAHKRALLIHRCFVSRNTDLLVHAFKVYVRPLLAYNSLSGHPLPSRILRQLKVYSGFIVCRTSRVYSV